MTSTLTLEHTPPGVFPDWLFSYLRAQILDPEQKRILVIHCSEAARAQILERLEDEQIGPIDRSLHHTLDSLRKSLYADCRLPRLLPTDATGERLLHMECELGAKEGDFPLLHPIPERKWGEGRTQALARLSQVFDAENVRDWNGPGMEGFSSRLKRIQRKLNGTHPLVHRRTLIDAIEARTTVPFLLTGLAGILLMNQSPTLPQSDRQLLRLLLRFCPIHQLCQHGDAAIGNHRLGLHGAIIEDVIPITPESMPEWLPHHDIWTPNRVENEVHRLLVPRRGLAIDATMELLRDWIAQAPPESSVLIIDPGWREREQSWHRGLIEIGLRPPLDSRPIKATPAIHWLGEMASICLGPEAWSMERLRGLGTQQSLQLSKEWYMPTSHPIHSDWEPKVDSERIESLARTWHIMGGHGALYRWLRALASPAHPAPWQDSNESEKQAECTQWWVLSLVQRLSPLLSPGERGLLDDASLRIGCASGVELPLPEPIVDGDQWLSSLFMHLDWESNMEAVGALQRLLEATISHRQIQSALGHRISIRGEAWIEELQCLIENLQGPLQETASDRVILSTPEDALGVSANLVVLTHLSNSEWNLRAERIPWLDDEERTRLDICRPDSPLRDARHAFHHLLHAGNQIVLIDPTGLDEDTQPAAPLAEWLIECVGSNSSEEVPRPPYLEDNCRWETASSTRTRGHHLAWFPSRIEIIRESNQAYTETHLRGRSQRNNRQRAGLALHDARTPESLPLQPSAISLPLDAQLMQDRIRRQPTEIHPDEEYLSMDLHQNFVAMGTLQIVPSKTGARGEITPRYAKSWPVLGGKSDNGNLLSTDPRPFKPDATSLPVFNQRNGYSEGASKSRSVWSASRLQRWQACPRQGWLERRLRADRIESQGDELDARIRGDIIHGTLGALFEKAFGLPEHIERDSKNATSLADLDEAPEILFSHMLDYLAEHAPWLEREDATAGQRRHDLIGLSRNDWLDWLASPRPMPPSGRLGRMLMAELELHNAIPLSIEWPLNGIDIPHPDGRSIRMNGYIDRVDLVNLEGVCNSDSELSIAPLNLLEHPEWKPHRLILIRDLKSIDGPRSTSVGSRHRKALFDELQLALYSRAWEIAHPGDLVVGAGISEIGSSTNHSLEASMNFADHLEENGVGDITRFTHATHRLPNTDSNPSTDAFRDWMQERLTKAIEIAAGADAGRVHATPNNVVCTWCNVKEACGLAPIVGGDQKWN